MTSLNTSRPEFTDRTNAPAAAWLLIHVGCTATVALLVAAARSNDAGPVLTAVLLLVFGVLTVFLFAPLHECVHRTAFASRRLNDAVATLIGFFLFVPARYFRHYHLAHHRHTQDPLRDPERGPQNKLREPIGLTAKLVHLTGLGHWWWAIRTLLMHSIGRTDHELPLSTAQRADVVWEARCHVAAYAGLFFLFPFTVLFGYWLLPMICAQPFLRAFLSAEHTGCDEGEDPLRNTRTTSSNALMRRLCWNMNYHAEHHVNARVPFYRLPALHAQIGPHLAHVERTYWLGTIHRLLE